MTKPTTTRDTVLLDQAAGRTQDTGALRQSREEYAQKTVAGAMDLKRVLSQPRGYADWRQGRRRRLLEAFPMLSFFQPYLPGCEISLVITRSI